MDRLRSDNGLIINCASQATKELRDAWREYVIKQIEESNARLENYKKFTRLPNWIVEEISQEGYEVIIIEKENTVERNYSEEERYMYKIKWND
ncbi:hypothetical protein H7E67_03860 [Clostridium gasigenes]|uniref:hypothetical protein n=1 Tax=Clostridium gasigenes TaxID=94869 RepID=UPI001628C186|nr:hypothetical protein [Clostridium gasigenes]MBB6622558.1 hypothetical protein [Clostridium gasigenes]